MVLKISCSFKHGLLLLTNGDVYSFGEEMHGELGRGDELSDDPPVLSKVLSSATDVATGRYHSAIISG